MVAVFFALVVFVALTAAELVWIQSSSLAQVEVGERGGGRHPDVSVAIRVRPS